MSRYWKADKATSTKIIAMLDEWYDTIKRGCKLAKSVGATDKVLTADVGFGALAVVGFIFKDESKVDRKQFVRLKHHSTGWRARHNKSELSKAFSDLRSYCKSDTADLIGMEMFDGLSFTTPGINVVGGVVYLVTNDKLKQAKGCTRITDVQFERITGDKKS